MSFSAACGARTLQTDPLRGPKMDRAEGANVWFCRLRKDFNEDAQSSIEFHMGASK
jgi:hypothetical protein